MGYDAFNAVGLIALAGAVCVAYLLRALIRGRAQYDRVERQGGSLLLGKGMMEMAYWSLQPIGRALVSMHVTPNMISWASLVLGGIAGVFLAYGQFGSAAVCATCSAFFDTLDGMVARLTGASSDAGEILDAAIDRYTEFFYLSGLVIYYREISYLQIIALFALMGSFMVSYSTAKAEAMHMRPPPGIMRRPERAFYLILGAALSALPFGWDAYFDFPVRVGVPMVAAIGFIAILANISAIERLYTIARDRRLQEIAAAEAEANAEEQPLPTPR